jgi:adenylate kinase
MPEKKTALSEEKTAGASYVLNFFSNVMQLNHYYANYENLMIELATKYAKEAGKETPEDKDSIRNFCQTLRYYATQAYIGYRAIMGGIGKPIDSELLKLHINIKESYVLSREEIEAYVIKMNSVIMNTVIKDILQNSQDLLNEIYNTSE